MNPDTPRIELPFADVAKRLAAAADAEAILDRVRARLGPQATRIGLMWRQGQEGIDTVVFEAATQPDLVAALKRLFPEREG